MTTLHLRIYEAVSSMRLARAAGDEEQVRAQAAEIADLADIAARHGVDISCAYTELAHAA
ncbi:hypothetical protein RIF23_13280 [Lipingzhangella sp. LS1_29]|uniref:Uncharacterized protein n=2 Tax=Lipingzhangella rawalii TaxID=2055835 RepID=A0ABU2H8U1_9ACTN|nr:hypothetical protein [Lipingzhangella rawalii]